MTLVVAASPTPILQFFSDDGTFLVGGQLFTSVGGVPYPTYADPFGLVQHANPIILNNRGEIATSSGQSAQLYLVPNITYTFALFDSQSNPIDTPTNIQGIPNALSLAALLNQAFIGAALYPLTPAEDIAGAIPQGPYVEGDMRRYGATSSSPDNSAALTTAMTVSAAGGNPAFIPGGTWPVTSASSVSGDWSIYGAGRSSIIALNGCNGPTFGNQSAAGGARFIRDLVIDGTNASSYIGLVCDLDSVAGRIDGVIISDVVFQNFSSPTGAAPMQGVTVTGLALWGRGMWSCTFRDCWFLNCYTTAYLYGLNTVPRFIDCEIILAPSLYNTIGTGGIIVDIDGAGHRTEDLKIRGCHLFGQDTGLDIRQVLHLEVLDNDIDDCNTTCIKLTQILGTGVIRDNWMATQALTGAISTGINMVNLGNNSVYNVIIDANEINCNTPSTASNGVIVGNFQSNTKVTNNTINGFQIGATVGAANDCKVEDNAILAIGNAIQITNLSTNVKIADNNILGGAPLALLSGNLPVGFKYHASGTVVLTLSGVGGSNTGIVNWFANGSQVLLYTSGITGPAIGTTMTATGLATQAPFLIPLTSQSFPVHLTDNSLGVTGTGVIDPTGLITFAKDANGGAFTNSGNRGISSGSMIWLYL